MNPILKRTLAGAAGVGALGLGVLVANQFGTAADHVDGPFVTANQATDIADVYSFQETPGHVVLAMTISGVQTAPDLLLGRSIFDKNTLYQFEIDADGDALEDFVIQGYVIGSPTNQKMEIVGPVAPDQANGTGSSARIVPQRGKPFRVDVSTDATPITATRSDGLKAFAGVRDDPFFFDLGAFQQVVADIGALAGGADVTPSFNTAGGTDFFAGLNVYAIVVEVPLSLLGGDASALAVWGTTSRRDP